MSLETTTIGELNSGAPLVGTDQFVIERVGGNNFKVTGDDIETFVGGFVSPLTTKGDLYTFDTADTRQGIGTEGQLLSVALAEDTGLLWVDPPSGGSTPVMKIDTANYQFGDGAPDFYYSLDFNESDTVIDDFLKSIVPKATVMTSVSVLVDSNTLDTSFDITLAVNGIDSALTVSIPATTTGTFALTTDVAVAVDDELLWHGLEGGGGTVGDLNFKVSYSWN